MPTYVYKCEDGHIHQIIQKITDEPIKECPVYFVSRPTADKVNEVIMCKKPVFRIIQKTSFTIR